MLLVAPQGWGLLLLVPLFFGISAEGLLRSFYSGTFPQAKHHDNQRWLWQKLDHYDPECKIFWRQRFFINHQFYRRGGPVFLELIGEEPANPESMAESALLTYAKRIGALYILLEHRYYGKSYPTKNISTANLRFLSSRQALRDAVHFQKFLIHKFRLFRNKWIVFGGSYAGSLAAWLKVKHPRKFHSAVAYSAPVYAKANFFEYLEIVQSALFRYGHSECVNAVQNASQILMYMLKHEKYHSNISSDFRLCEPLSTHSEEKIFFLDVLINRITTLVQYSKERPLSLNQTNYDFDKNVIKSDVTLNYFCQLMTNKSLGTPYERYAYFSNKNLEAKEDSCLYVNYDRYIAMLRNPEWNGEAAKGSRQWFYQICTEFGFFQTTDSKHQPFLGVPMSYFIDQCKKIYDIDFDDNSVLESVKETNSYYYNHLMKTGRRILFPNGDLDPWHALSINFRMKRNLIGMSIGNSYHCEAMFRNEDDDPHNLKVARQFIFKTLISWLSQ